MESRTAKRRRCNEIKDHIVDETHTLVMNSAKMVTDIQTTKADLAEYYSSLTDKHSELISQAMGINEQYGAIVDLLKGTKRPRVGETSEVRQHLPTAYAADVHRYVDDIYTSLENHSKEYNEVCDQIIKEFETTSDAWIKKLHDLKEQGDEMQNLKVQLRVQFHEFKKNVSP